MTPRFLGIVILSLIFQINAFGSPKIALVRVKDIYVEQPATKAAQEKARKAKESVLLDPRAEELREGIEALRELQKRISNPNKQPSNEEGRKLAREFEIKRLEIRTLQEDFEKFRAEREKEINTEMVAEMRAILDRIAALSRRTAQEKGYEIVIDSSGNTNSSVPFVLYAKNSPDITDDVIAAMKDDQASRENTHRPIISDPAPSAPSDDKPSEP
jgi:Skp family chaperone for outer membrane proteins